MLQDQNRHIAKLLTAAALLILAMISFDRASAFETTLASTPPERCTGYGALQSISLTDWEAGLGSWTVGTHDVEDPNTFDTPDWAVVENLPDSRTGMAAFVANLDIGDCGADDETGALTLDSPPIVLPGDAPVPRISIDHWFQTEFGWDGGNFKISVNGGAFNLVPASAIEVAPYNDTLFPAPRPIRGHPQQLQPARRSGWVHRDGRRPADRQLDAVAHQPPGNGRSGRHH